MSKFDLDTCSCCGDIFERSNFQKVNLGLNHLDFCPDCYKKFFERMYSAFEGGYKSACVNAPRKADIKRAFDVWNHG